MFQVDGDNIIKTIVNEEAVEKATAAQLAAKDEQKVAVSGLALLTPELFLYRFNEFFESLSFH